MSSPVKMVITGNHVDRRHSCAGRMQRLCAAPLRDPMTSAFASGACSYARKMLRRGEIIGRLNAAAVEALADLAVRSRFVDLGMKVFPRDRRRQRRSAHCRRPRSRNGGR
jgi:hypothetical protein